MKSRKLGMFAKRSPSRNTSAKLRQSKRVFRRGMIEQLEDRKLMTVQPWSDGLYYPPIGKVTAFLPPSITYQQYAAISDAQYGNGPTPLVGEGSGGGSTSFITVSEVEPNNVPTRAQVLPLGTSAGQNQRVQVIGNLPTAVPGVNADEDYFAFDLKAGDILDASISASIGRAFDLSIRDSNNLEVIGNNGPVGAGYPAISPLTVGGVASLAFVAPADGRYYARVSDGNRAYTLDLRCYRAVLESAPVGTKQTIFLDFDGAIFNREAYGVPGTARLSPLSTFLPGWNVLPQDEGRIINEIVSIFTSKFIGATALSSTGNNGWYSATGVAGDFDIQILNSKDHADPWGLPNVSRIVIGGTQAQLGIGTIGIAESIDVGNFDTSESSVVLLDLINPLWGPIPRVATIPLSTVLADAVASVAAHEAGHFFGAWHSPNNNPSDQIMDSGGNLTGLLGVGPDGIYGTADDRDVQFGTDVYDPFASAIPFGRQNSAATLAAGLATGMAGGGQIRGNVFHDRNINRAKDSSDLPLANVKVYADTNGNGVHDSTEFFALSNAVGDYVLSVPAGTYTLRQVVPTGYRLTTPVSGSINVTVTASGTVNNINFGQELLSLNATGAKWNDVNGNGLRDPGEGVITGVRMYLDLDGDQRIDIGEPSAKSNELGQYTLTFPGPGTYKIREVVDPGYVQTFPNAASNFEHTVVVTGNPAVDGPNLAGLNFGNKLTVDFGDAPATFGEASAGFKPGLLLGANWDDEQSSAFSANALGDDTAGRLDANDVVIDDEDGVIFTRPLVAGNANNSIAVTAVNTTGVSAYLSGWVDFNRDGDFSDSGEQIYSNTVVPSGRTSLTFAAPANASLGTTFARFRYSNERDVPVTGRSLSGEVEDYQVNIVATLDLAVNDRFSVTRNSVLNPLDVLANDFSLPGERLEIASTSGSSAGGVVQISADNRILYTPPAGFIGQDTFSYTMRNAAGETDTANVTIDVRLFFVDPIAVDDSFDFALNAIDLPLNVLANDIEGQAGALTIIMVTQPSGGGQVSIASGGKSLRYTPVRNFIGTETLTYTVADSNGKQSTAKVTLHTTSFVRENTDVIYSLRTTDLNGNQITAIPQGQDFKLEVYVDDFRNDRAAPSNAPGVFAAYMDLLYNLQLVTTAIPQAGNSLNFDVTFGNGYTNGLSGNSTTPGLINEFGAFYNLQSDPNNPGTMNLPDQVRIASITFTARSPGIVNFVTDPADVSPLNDTLLFDVPNSPVPLGRIRYLSTSLEIVGDSTEFPRAIDDSLATAIPFGATRFPINVRANDLPGSTGIINVTRTTQGLNGSTSIDAQGRVLYTPNGGFSGADQFSYTIEDARGISSQATVTVRVGAAESNDIVDLRLEVTDLNGAPITTIAVGGTFQLRGYVKDLRSARPNQGIYAAYQDVLYSSNLVSPRTKAVTATDPLGFEVIFGTNYSEVLSGDITNKGIINELGAVQKGNPPLPLGAAEQLLFIINLDAKSVGTATFIGDPADIKPLHDTLTYDPAVAIGYDFIRYGSDTLNITSTGSLGGGEFTNLKDRHDVNNDGFVSPIDALIVINRLNGNGSTASGEGENDKFYIDVNGDNNLSPIDALLVINRLNSQRNGAGAGAGEGEGEGSSSLASAADSVFGEENGMDQLLSQLAPDIEELRKRR